jgi:hypothetical protein
MNSPRTSVLIETGTNDELILGGKGADDHGTVVKVVENVSNPESGMLAQIASDYNTGYQVGDIKLATLSDTDTTNAVGTELVTNGTFASNTTGWAGVSGTIAIASSQLRLTGGGSSTVVAYAQQTFATTVGKAYTVSVDFISISGGTNRYIYIGTSTSGANRFNIVQLSNAQVVVGTNTFTFVAQSTTSLISLGTYEAQVAVWDNVTVRLAEEDRSWNGNGVQVFGTVTKTAVATGADLVAYSGFSTSNYLEQPYNSSLGLSSTDYLTIMCWVKQASHNGTIQVIFASGVMTTGQGRYLYTNAGIPRLDTYGGATNNSTRDITDNTWHHLTAIYTPNGIGYMYIDGILDATPSLTAGYINQSANANVRIGLERNNTLPTNASISLLRVSNSIPSAEQIAKIYNDEKHLFQTNAKATLYGSSDAVTALAYDDDTELLHVGTSAGRSEFQGLNRVNNTTDAVGTAISASNGFIVEE